MSGPDPMTTGTARTDTEIALARLRVDVLNALEFGATREQIDAEVRRAQQLAAKGSSNARADAPTTEGR